MPLVHKVCALTDPFCEHARNAMYPDSTGGKVLTEQIRFTYAGQNDGSGQIFCGFQANPLYPFLSYTGAITATQAGTAAAFSSPGYTGQFATYGKSARVVSWGVRIINLAGMTTSGGTCSMMVGDALALSTNIVYAPVNWNYCQVQPLTHGAQFCFISRPYGAGARDFIPVATYNSTTYANEDWECLYFYAASNGPGITTLQFEFVMNIEFTLGAAGSAFATYAKQSPANSPLLQTAASKVQTSMSPLLAASADRFARKIEDKAANALVSLGVGALGAIGGAIVGGPAGAAAGFSIGAGGTQMLMNGNAVELD